MHPRIAILASGSEILDGRVLDSNSNFIARKLSELGLKLEQVLTVGDSMQDLKSALHYLTSTNDLVLISGGMGPTTDDLTREAVAEFASTELVSDSNSLERLKEFFLKRNRPFDPSNTKQASFPRNAQILENPKGSAPGFILELSNRGSERRFLAAMPGVPNELFAMFDAHIVPFIQAQFRNVHPLTKRAFRVFGVPESVLGRRVSECCCPDEILVSYRAHFPEVQIVLKTNDDRINLDPWAQKVAQAIGSEFIFSRDLSLGFQKSVQQLLVAKKMKVAVAESCSGGMLCTLLTDTPGSSDCFSGGTVTYSNDSKVQLLHVDSQIFLRDGAVSHACAQAMAQGVLKALKADLGISITGVAGPDGGSIEKPVGTFFTGFATPSKTESFHYLYPGDRTRVQTFAAWTGLDLIRRHLSGFRLKSDY